MDEVVVVVFHSADSGELRDECGRGRVPTQLILEASVMDGVAVAFRSINSGELRDGCRGFEWCSSPLILENNDGFPCLWRVGFPFR